MNATQKPSTPLAEASTAVQLVTSPVPSFYVEGITQFSVGAPVCRLLLHASSQQESGDPLGPQQRQLAVELVVPFVQLLEMAKTLTNVLADNVGAYDRLKVEQEQRMTALLAELQGKQ